MKRSFFLLCGALILATFPAAADSVYYATPTTLQVTIKKFEICADSSCSNPAVLGSGDALFDIASQSSGSSIGNYAANASIPRGVTYNYARLTISRTFVLSGAASVPGVGTVNQAAAACYTKTSNPNTGKSEIETTTAVASANLTAAKAAATAQEIFLESGPPPDNDALISEVYTADSEIGVYKLASPLRLESDSQAPEISISIDATNAMSFYADGADCYADEEPPTISITVQ